MASVELQSARTAIADPNGAAEDMVKRLTGADPKLVVLFASRDRDQVGGLDQHRQDHGEPTAAPDEPGEEFGADDNRERHEREIDRQARIIAGELVRGGAPRPRSRFAVPMATP